MFLKHAKILYENLKHLNKKGSFLFPGILFGEHGFFASIRMTFACHCEHTAGMLRFSVCGTVKTVPYCNAAGFIETS